MTAVILRRRWAMPAVIIIHAPNHSEPSPSHARAMPARCPRSNCDITATSNSARQCTLASAAPLNYAKTVSTISLGPVVVEFLRLKASGRLAPAYSVAGKDGHVEFCGSEDAATLTVVAPSGTALTVLGVGTREKTVEIWEAISPAGRFWDLKPNCVLFGGVERVFRPLGGSLVIGYVDSGDLSVILCQLGGRVGIVTCEGGVPTLIFVGAYAEALGVADLDTHRLLINRPRISRPQPATPCDGELSQLIARALRDLAARCMSLDSGGDYRRGKRDIGAFAELLIALGGLGCGDLAGTSADMCKQIHTYFPGREVVSPRKLSEVLRLVVRTSTCLVDRPTDRGWLIRLGELRRAGGQLLKRFIAESPPSSPLSLPASPSFEGLFVRSRKASALDELREKLAAAVPKVAKP